MRSFRSTLALRVGLGTLGVGLALGFGAIVLLRARLFSNLDASLLEIASLETSYGADSVSSEFQFRSDYFKPSSGDPAPPFWAQLLSGEGIPLVLSPNLAAPLPVPLDALRLSNSGRAAFVSQRAPAPGAAGRAGPEAVPLRTVIFPMGARGTGHLDHRLQVSASLVPVETSLGQFALIALGVSLSGAVIAWLLALVVAKHAITPALELARSVEAIGVQELGRRVTVPGELAEIGRITVAFNGLLERIERAVTGTRRFTADASHELRAPLTVLRGELELALQRPRSAGEYEEVIRRCLDEVLRLSRLADDLLTLARVEGGAVGGVRTPVELDELVARALERKGSLVEQRRVGVELSGTAGVIVGDPDLLVRALDGLLEHAIMASPEGGAVRVRLEAPNGVRSVRVTDSGPGLAPDEVAGIFQRFYRSRQARIRSPESGLGLAIARAVAERHGGVVEYAGNDPGASFRLSLPAAPPTERED